MKIARRLLVPATVFVALCLAAGASPAIGASPGPPGWTQSGYSWTHTASNPRETTLSPTNVGSLEVAWSRSLGVDQSVEASVAVSGGRAYVLTFDGTLAALQAATGRRVWSVSVGGSSATTSPALTAHDVIASYETDHAWTAAFDRQTGARTWTASLSGHATMATPVVVGNAVYLATGSDIYRLSASTGDIVWHRTITTDPESSGVWGPVAVSADGAHVVAATLDGTVFDLRTSTGAIRWQTTAGGGIFRGGPAISGDTIYVPEGATGAEGGGFDIVALRLADGVQVWRGFAGDDIHTTPAVGGGLVYIGAIDTGFRALDAGTGAERWAIESLPEIWSQAAVANGVVYVSTESTFFAADARTGTQLFSTVIGSGFANMSPPVVWSGQLYVGSGEGIVRAFSLR
jgi:outer membrane protein assembly factor BamB